MTTPAIWRRAFSDIDSASFGLNYDPSHSVLRGMDPASPLAEFRDKLSGRPDESHQSRAQHSRAFFLPEE